MDSFSDQLFVDLRPSIERYSRTISGGSGKEELTTMFSD